MPHASDVGICFGLFPEGLEEDCPVEAQGDGKDLTDLVVWLWWEPHTIPRLGLPPPAAAVLSEMEVPLRMDDEFESFMRIMFDAARMKSALVALRDALKRVEADPVLSKNTPAPGSNLSRRKLRERLGYYDMALEDPIRVCEWSEANGRRVHFLVW